MATVHPQVISSLKPPQVISSLKPSSRCKRGPDMSFENNSKLKLRAVLFDFFDDHQANKVESYNGDESGDDEIFLWNLKKSEIPSFQAKARKGGQDSDSHLSTLSADKALRAAMLKKRFASTISKATRFQQENERLEIKKLQEKARNEKEKARIDEETKAAEVASLQKKAQREKQREATRIALEKMEGSVVIDDSQEICKEFEMVFRCFQYGTMFPQYQLSPEIRAEMLLKKRSASTISKVTHQGNMQQEKERLEKKQREEKARIEEETKAAEVAQREKERKIARMALEKMERVIMFDDGQEICREFEVQLCCFQYGTMFPH